MYKTIIDSDSFSYNKIINVKCSPHVNLSMEIILVTKGEIKINANDKQYVIKENQAFFIMPFEMHNFITETYSECYVIMFSNQNTNLFNDTFKDYLPSPRNLTLDVEVINWINYKLRENKTLNELEVLSVLTPLFNEIKAKCKEKEPKLEFKDFFYDALKVINYNLDKTNSLVSVAKEIGVHPVTLSKAFKKYAGMSFVEYVNYRRISSAQSKIAEGEKSIDVAFETGFGSVRSFNREFKKYFGVTPTKYKENKKQ